MRKWVSSPEYRAVVAQLVAARHESGLTQREVEARLGKTHHGWLAKIEANERQANVIDMIAILRAVGADERAFFDQLLTQLPVQFEV